MGWDEFKEQQRKKGEMEGDMDKVEQEAQDRFRKELDADRAQRLARNKGTEEEAGSKKKKKDKHKSKKEKKEKKEKSKKKKRHRDSSDSDSSSEDVKRSKSSKGGMQAPVSLSSFFSAGDSD